MTPAKRTEIDQKARELCGLLYDEAERIRAKYEKAKLGDRTAYSLVSRLPRMAAIVSENCSLAITGMSMVDDLLDSKIKEKPNAS